MIIVFRENKKLNIKKLTEREKKSNRDENIIKIDNETRKETLKLIETIKQM